MTTIKLKNGSGAPTAGDLAQGEPALDLTNKRLYTEDSGGTVIEVGTNPTSVTTGAITVGDSHTIGNGTGDNLLIQSSSGENITLRAGSTREILLQTDNSSGNAVQIYANNDVAFYEDTGNTPKLFWDASAERLGVGSSSPTEQLDVQLNAIVNESGAGDKGLFVGPSGFAGSFVYKSSGDAEIAPRSGKSLLFAASTGGTERMRIDSSGNVGINQSSPTRKLHVTSAGSGVVAVFGDSAYNNTVEVTRTTTNASYIGLSATSAVGGIIAGPTFTFSTCNSGGGSVTERMRLDGSGHLLVGTTSTSTATQGIKLRSDLDAIAAVADGQISGYFGRLNSDGDILNFRKDGTTVGSIGTSSSSLYIGKSSGAGLMFQGGNMIPVTDGSAADDTYDLGASAVRFDDVYATNGTIQTSDRNEKQDIEALSDAEQRVAVACKGLLRKFRWKSSVSESGDDARIHFGIIAQDLQAAFETEGLDAGRYAMFINSTWTDEETGEERTRMGVRYSELLAFIIAAI